jgi:hypothetical protein
VHGGSARGDVLNAILSGRPPSSAVDHYLQFQGCTGSQLIRLPRQGAPPDMAEWMSHLWLGGVIQATYQATYNRVRHSGIWAGAVMSGDAEDTEQDEIVDTSPYALFCLTLQGIYQTGNVVQVSPQCTLHGPTLSMEEANVRRIMHRFGEQIDVHLAQMRQDGKIDYDITGGSWYIVLKSDDEATEPATEPAANTAWHQLCDRTGSVLDHPLLGRRFRRARAPVVGTTIRVAESQEEGEEAEEEADSDAGVLGPPASEGDHFDSAGWRRMQGANDSSQSSLGWASMYYSKE